MNEDMEMPKVPINYSILSNPDKLQTILSRQSGGQTHQIKLPNSNAIGYLHNDGAGLLDWSAAPQGPQGPQGAQGISGTGGGGSGMISFYTGTDTIIPLVQNIDAVANPVTTLVNTNDSIFSSPSAGKIVYTSVGSKYYKIFINAAIHALASNKIIRYTMMKNGNIVLFSTTQHHNNQEYEMITMSYIILLNQNDYIELYMTAIDGSYSVHIYSLSIIIDPC